MRMNCNFSSEVELKQLLKILNSKFAVYKPMNKITILAIGAVFAVSMIAIAAIEVEGAPPSKVACPAENVQHWDTWRFIYNVDLTHATNPTIEINTAHHMKFEVDPTVPYNEKIKIVDRLIELGYTDSGTGGDPFVANLGSGSFAFEGSTIICAKI